MDMTNKEYGLLVLFIRNKNVALFKETLYEKVWGDQAYGAENTVAVHIRHIREKLEIDPANPRYIKVVWGLGYKFEKV